MQEWSEDRYLQLKTVLQPFDVDEVKIKLFTLLPEIEVPLIETLFWIADAVGTDETAELFFAVRALFKYMENPNTGKEQSQTMFDYYLSMYDEFTERILIPSGVPRSALTEDMIPAGYLNIQLSKLEREEFLVRLQEMETEDNQLTLAEIKTRIAGELSQILSNPYLSEDDQIIFLRLLGLDEVSHTDVQVSPSIWNDLSKRTGHYGQILDIGGALSDGWKTNIWNNPYLDPSFYQKLIKAGFKDEALLPVIAELAEQSDIHQLLSLIRGESLVDERLKIAVKVFLRKIRNQVTAESWQNARLKVDLALSKTTLDRENLYKILLGLLLENK